MPDLSDVTTSELIAELRKRTSVFFCCYRPLIAYTPGCPHGWEASWDVDGGREGPAEPEDFSRVLGLVGIVTTKLIMDSQTMARPQEDDP